MIVFDMKNSPERKMDFRPTQLLRLWCKVCGACTQTTTVFSAILVERNPKAEFQLLEEPPVYISAHES